MRESYNREALFRRKHPIKSFWQKFLLLLFLTAIISGNAFAHPSDSIRDYTEENPLIYEDAWDLWPYSYLNERGEPEGYNIDLMRMILDELKIPYKIKLKPTKEARQDLHDGKSDVMMNMQAYFTKAIGRYGKTTVNIFTQSLVIPQNMQVDIKDGEDLKNYDVIVHTGSFSHHYIEDRHWNKSIEASNDMQESIQKVSSQDKGIILWNTMSLKWLMRKYKTDNLKMVPIDLPYGEYKFMSNDSLLLAKLDSTYTLLNASDKLQPLLNKWFYPERQDSGIPAWIWKLIVVFGIIAFGIIIYYFVYKAREQRMTEHVRMNNRRLSLILSSSGISFWTYHVATKTFNIMNEKGEPVKLYSSEEFARRYNPEAFKELNEALKKIINMEEETVTLRNRVTEEEGEVNEVHDYLITLSVFNKDKEGRPTVILCSRNDVTDEVERQILTNSMMLRYQSIFNNAIVDMVYYDQDGYITDMNERACRTFHLDLQKVIRDKINIREFLQLRDLNIKEFEYFHASVLLDNMIYELQLLPIFNEDHIKQCIYGTGRNMTEVVSTYRGKQQAIKELQAANESISHYIRNIDNVLTMGGIRIARYNTQSHTLTIFNEINHAVYSLTQTRALSLVADDSKKKAQRLLNNLDNHVTHTVSADIKTVLRQRGGIPLYIQIHFIPITGDDGNISEYFGMCRDISKIKAVEEQLAKETDKAQEVETVKNAFLRNMSYEIRTPLNTVVGFAELFEMEHSTEDEQVFIQQIKDNSRLLLKLINDILFLSRLDAGMIEIKPKPIDFAAIFDTRCQSFWDDDQIPGVNYITKNPYQRLVVDIDEMNFFIIIEKIIANAVQHTTSGFVLARYEYIGEILVVSIEDTGEGIKKEAVDHIFERFVTGANNGAGLGLSICRELITQMGGSVNLKSKEGQGTTVWVSLPCKVNDMAFKEEGGHL